MADLTIRRAETDADLEAWNRVRRIVVPDEPIATIEQMRSMAAEPDRFFFLAELDGETVGSGVASDSNLADGFAMPRVLPEHRTARVRVGGPRGAPRPPCRRRSSDGLVARRGRAALAFATHHGFVEIDRQIEQVRTIASDEPDPPPYPGVEFTTVAADPACSTAPTRRRHAGLCGHGARDRSGPRAARRVAPRRGDAAWRIDRGARRRRDRRLGRTHRLERRRHAGRERPDRRRPGLARPRPCHRAQAPPAGLGRRQWPPRARDLDAAGQRGDAARQHGLGYVTRSISRTSCRDRRADADRVSFGHDEDPGHRRRRLCRLGLGRGAPRRRPRGRRPRRPDDRPPRGGPGRGDAPRRHVRRPGGATRLLEAERIEAHPPLRRALAGR